MLPRLPSVFWTIFANAIISPHKKIIPNPVNTVLFNPQCKLSSVINNADNAGAYKPISKQMWPKITANHFYIFLRMMTFYYYFLHEQLLGGVSPLIYIVWHPQGQFKTTFSHLGFTGKNASLLHPIILEYELYNKPLFLVDN